MSKKSSTFLSLAIISILLAAGLVGCAGKQTSTTAPAGVGVVTESTLTDTVDSSGSIQANQVESLKWKTSGIVSSVSVAAGTTVKKGDVIMELDSTSVPIDVIQGMVDLEEAKLNLEKAKSMSSTANALVALVAAQSAYDDAKNAYASLNYTIGSDSTIASTEVSIDLAVITLKNADKKLTNLRNKNADDTLILKAEQEQIAAQQNLDSLRMELEYLESKPSDLDATKYSANLQLAQANLDAAQRAYDRVKDGPNPDDVAVAQAEVDVAQASVNKMKIIAPFDGTIVALENQVGDEVDESEEAVILVNRDKMYVNVEIDETSIGSIKVGDKTAISFDAFPGKDTTGLVTFINPIGNSASGVVNYTVRVDLDKADASILIGATASVSIQISNAQSTLLVPVAAVLSDAQGEYVMRVTNNGTVRVTVVSGQIVDSNVVVAGDLKSGDKVQLFASSTATSSSGQQGQQGGGGMIPGGGMMP